MAPSGNVAHVVPVRNVADMAVLTLPCPWCGGARVVLAIAEYDAEVVLCSDCDGTHATSASED